MERDKRMGAGHWRGCHTFTNITYDGSLNNSAPVRSGGLKMGCTYWYYVRLRKPLTTFHHLMIHLVFAGRRRRTLQRGRTNDNTLSISTWPTCQRDSNTHCSSRYDFHSHIEEPKCSKTTTDYESRR